MQFKLTTVVATLLACQAAQASPVVARETQEHAITVNDFVGYIDQITQQASKTTDMIKSLTPENSKAELLAAVKNIQGTSQIVEKAKSELAGVQGVQINGDDQVKICNALSGFFNTENELFGAVTSKKDIIKGTPDVPNLGTGIRAISAGVDQIPVNIVAGVWPCAGGVANTIKTLSASEQKKLQCRAETSIASHNDQLVWTSNKLPCFPLNLGSVAEVLNWKVKQRYGRAARDWRV